MMRWSRRCFGLLRTIPLDALLRRDGLDTSMAIYVGHVL
jgi:hypothetical protein